MAVYESDFRTVSLNEAGTAVRIIDQTLLPNEVVWRELTAIEEVWAAIKTLAVRGAPAIGVAAAGGLAVAAGQINAEDFDGFYREFSRLKAYLASSRPTAVNLTWALERMDRAVLQYAESAESIGSIKERLLAEANAICDEDEACCRAIGENGLPLIEGCRAVLTHCNAGRLAAVRYGTALAPLYMAAEKGAAPKVYADETRPLLQGARLTAWELSQAGIEVELLCDNMAATLLSQGKVDAIIVGADRIAANGDAANKIGTYNLALLAQCFDIPFYIAAPCSTIDIECAAGQNIVIEQRDPNEVTEQWYAKRMAPQGIAVFNPAFDVTPHQLISAIITERGVLRAPFDVAIAEMLG